jgi:hypothetical protein
MREADISPQLSEGCQRPFSCYPAFWEFCSVFATTEAMSRFTETRSCDPMLILRFCGGDWLECPTTGQSSMQRILADNGGKGP